MNNDFEKLIARLTPTVRRISHRLNGHFAFFNDDDLCQEALMYLWSAFQSGKLTDKTDSYMLQGCYFHLKNYIRSSADRAHFKSLDSTIDGENTALQDTLAAPDDGGLDAFEEKCLRGSTGPETLSAREETILRLSMEGQTTREIGRRFGISHVAVVKIKKRLREKYRNLKNEIDMRKDRSGAGGLR